MTKGDVFGVTRLAGIAAAKRTPELIPLARPPAIHHAAIETLHHPSWSLSSGDRTRLTVRRFEPPQIRRTALLP
ncbi:MAG: cyclic pyranopterin monophosphate synthase MoaC [Candidatus Deferrimicrobiaceae bacterium]